MGWGHVCGEPKWEHRQVITGRDAGEATEGGHRARRGVQGGTG